MPMSDMAWQQWDGNVELTLFAGKKELQTGGARRTPRPPVVTGRQDIVEVDASTARQRLHSFKQNESRVLIRKCLSPSKLSVPLQQSTGANTRI